MALCLGQPRRASTRKVKPIWILLKQETVSGSGISLAICKFAPRSRQITMPAPHHSVFYRLDALFLPPNQQRRRQSTEGIVFKHWSEKTRNSGVHVSPGSAETLVRRVAKNKSLFDSLLTHQHFCQKLSKRVDVRQRYSVPSQCRCSETQGTTLALSMNGQWSAELLVPCWQQQSVQLADNQGAPSTPPCRLV